MAASVLYHFKRNRFNLKMREFCTRNINIIYVTFPSIVLTVKRYFGARKQNGINSKRLLKRPAPLPFIVNTDDFP